MITPVKEDGITPEYPNDPGFYLVAKGNRYWIQYFTEHTSLVSHRRYWRRVAEVSADRRSPDFSGPGDGVADMVVGILMSEDSLHGLSILEYFSNMGLDVYSDTIWSRFKRWLGGKK